MKKIILVKNSNTRVGLKQLEKQNDGKYFT